VEKDVRSEDPYHTERGLLADVEARLTATTFNCSSGTSNQLYIQRFTMRRSFQRALETTARIGDIRFNAMMEA
jgi:hypothetical protein